MSSIPALAPAAPTADRSTATSLAAALMLLSGLAGLGYQIVWTQQASAWLGHDAVAVLAVVAAFFGGIALGASTLGRRIERGTHPWRWYAACEITIASWSVLLALTIGPIGEWLLDLTGAQPTGAWQWSVAFFGSFALFLPATAAMGATLPAMARITAAAGLRGLSVATLYASNTVGAVIGVLAAAFWLVPAYGLATTSAVCAGINLLCAAIAWRQTGSAPGTMTPPSTEGARRTLALLAFTGLFGIGYEVLVVRVLSQVCENTVYTFAMLLAVYLIGSALGAAAYRHWLERRADPDRLGDLLLWCTGLACLLGTGALWWADAAMLAVRGASGGGMAGAIAGEAAAALAAFLCPTVAMGALFSHLAGQARVHGSSLGAALGVNTLGAAMAPWLFGVVLLPALGSKLALLLVTAGYLVLSSRSAWQRPRLWAAAAVTALVAGVAPALTLVDVPDGGRLVSYREGAMGAVSVVEDAAGVSRLRIDNRQQEGSSASLLADTRLALLPMLLHPGPRQALFLGLGTGVTATAAAQEPQLRVEAVELLPEVIAASAHFRDQTGPSSAAGRLELLVADARRHVRAGTRQYDVIVSDNFHPARSGSGALYTVEHFRAVRARLAPQGLFCQWLPLHQLDLATLRSIVRSFASVYPAGWAILATNSLETPVIGLVARADDRRFKLAEVRARLRHITLPHPAADFGIHDDLALLGSFIAGPGALDRLAREAPLNTDDHPVVAYMAPRVTYAPDSRPADRLIQLLQNLHVDAAELFDEPPDPAWSGRLAAYVAARNRFILAGRGVEPTSDVRRMLEQVRAPLLGVLGTSADFRPAYDPLLRMAMALSASDPAAASDLLTQLDTLQPARPEAAEALRNLGSAPR